MTAIDIGWEVYSKTRTHLDSVSSPVGGIVVALTSVVDPETGETEDAYVVIDSWHGLLRREVIAIGDIEHEGARLAPERVVADVVRRLARKVGANPTRARGATTWDILNIRDMKALHDCLIERNGPAYYGLDTLRPAKPAEPRPTMPPNVKAICE